MSRQLSGALGIATLVTVTRNSHATGPASVVHGYHAALLVIAAVSLVAGLLSLLLRP
jgi:hypothetical protein